VTKPSPAAVYQRCVVSGHTGHRRKSTDPEPRARQEALVVRIRCGDSTVAVHTEPSDLVHRDGGRPLMYVAECCSARYETLRQLAISHVMGCPCDTAIELMLASELPQAPAT
jgi:hypothetical protein